MKKFWKKYLSWTLPSKMTFWGFLLTAITTPSAIIGYFNYFGNDDIAEKLYRSLQVNIRPHLDIKSIYIDDYIEDGQVLGFRNRKFILKIFRG